MARAERQRAAVDAATLRAHAQALPGIDDPDFAAPVDALLDGVRLVLIGEASHGTAEFYRARAAITRRLIERHGFTVVALEADWPDAAIVDGHVRGRPRAADTPPVFQRFPRWMWRNREVEGFLAWLRNWNDGRPAEQRVALRGLDLYSLRESMTAVLGYLDRHDAEAAAAARRRYGCLTPWQDDPADYGRRALSGLADCEAAVVGQLQELLHRRLQAGGADGEALFDAEQNARTVRAAERYYRVMYQGSRASWNLRDSHMFETLERVLRHHGRDARAVVWAHNSHLGDARATEMGAAGELNLGQLCRERHGRAALLIGQGTDRGQVAAADDWDAPMQVKAVNPSLPHSWEHAFLDAGIGCSLTSWRDDARLASRLAEPLLERAIGVIYRPHTERFSHYFDARLGEQFDAWLWFEETSAVTAIGPEPAAGSADTWPFAV